MPNTIHRLLATLLLSLNVGCGMADTIHTGGTNNLKKWYGPMIPEENAKQIWFMQVDCERYRLGVSTLKQDPCVLFDQELELVKRLCEEKQNGNPQFANATACEELEIYETKYKNMPMPPYQRQPTNKPGVQCVQRVQ